MSRQHSRTESPRCSEQRCRLTNICRRMQSPGAVDRFHHFEFKNLPIIKVGGGLLGDGALMGLFLGHCKNTRTKSPPRSGRRPTNRCQRMQLPGAVDRFCHFEFKNPPIIEVRGDFWVMGRSRAYFWGTVKTLERNPLLAVNRGVAQQIAVNVCNC